MKSNSRTGIRKSVLILVMLLALASVLAGCGTNGNLIKNYYDLDVVDHTSDFYVNDFAGVFSEEEKKELMAKAVGFDEEYSGIQVVITTVESLDEAVLGYEYVVEDENGNRVEDSEIKQPSENPKFTIEQVAYSMYSQYGIGQDDMGILILFSTGDREVRIETGRQMQFYITDSISGRLLDDYGMDYFVEDKFAEGLVSLQTGVIDEIKSKVSIDWAASSEGSKKDSENATVGSVVGDAETNPDNASIVTNEETKEKDPAKGILFGLFGSIAAAFAAIAAFFRQRFKGKSEKENLEKAKQEEIDSLKADFQAQLENQEKAHQAEISRMKRDYQRLVQVRDNDVEELNHEISEANKQIGTLKKQLEGMTDMFNRAQRLHPEYNFNEEVHEMIEGEYKAEAQEIDSKIAEVIAIPANKDNDDVFNRALLLFDGAGSEVKKYITADRNQIQELYEEAIRLKKAFEKEQQEKRDKAAANDAYNRIQSVFSENPQGNHRTYDSLHAALAIFLGLTAAEKAFFPDNNLIANLKKVHSSAESDYKDYNEAKDAESEVESIIGRMSSADEDDRDKLESAMRYYRNLSSAQQAYFSQELLRKLKKLIEDAEDDHRRQERRRDDERRRRQQQMRSSSSFSSSHRSSFGGHGGRPSGGGASRRF